MKVVIKYRDCEFIQLDIDDKEHQQTADLVLTREEAKNIAEYILEFLNNEKAQ